MSPPDFEIEIDHAACRGAGVCVRVAPKSFALDSDQRSRVLGTVGDTPENLQTAADRCPYFAIKLSQRRSEADSRR
ncbi:MAG: hypothetical protein CBC48_00035 [bacterium TMED88]|nr:ferredoxin [Deltaproteobacteria bacterium]OUV37708.1 MAG: hypothetical protein CBC48_00035 [bacterium TMED88]